MSRILGIGLAVLVTVAVGLVPGVAAEPPQELRIGMLQGMFKDVPPVLIQAVSKPFSDLFSKQAGLKGAVELFQDSDALAVKMNEGRVDIGVFHGFEFAWIRQQHPNIRPLAVTMPPGHEVRACLIVPKASKATTPADLVGVNVTLPKGTKAHCQLYLDRLRKTLPATCCLHPTAMPTMTSEEVLDAVADGRLPATLVDATALATYQNNKPGMFNKLHTLSRSESFPPAVIAIRNGSLDAATTTKVRNGLIGANGTAQGRSFMMLWNLKGFEAMPTDFDEQMQRSFTNYPPATAVVRPPIKLTTGE